MRIVCQHGYFTFIQTGTGQISDFASMTGLSIVPKGLNYTFSFLEDAPKFSIIGKPIFGIPAIKTYEGSEHEIFEENLLVYDFSKNLVVPIFSVTQVVSIKPAGNRFVSNGLILPGSITEDGKRVKDYAAWYSQERLTWLYSEVGYV